MRSVPLRLLSLAVLPAALLAGCADAPTSTSSGTTSPGASAGATAANLDGVTVTPGAAGADPVLALKDKPLRVKDAVSRSLKDGTGAVIDEKSSLDVKFAQFSGVDGAKMATSGGKNAILRMGDANTPKAFTDALKGKKIGSQVVLAMPAAKILNEQQLPKGMTLDDSVLYVIDVLSAHAVLDKATGTAVPPVAGLPTVEVPDDVKQPAKITVPSPTPIKETKVQPLIKGEGKPVTKGQTIRVRYTGVTWRDPANPFDYSGKREPEPTEFPIGQGGLIKAWDNGIPGQTVGSRLLIVVQPADGYGDKGGAGGKIKGDDVLIFVLDILDAYDS